MNILKLVTPSRVMSAISLSCAGGTSVAIMWKP